MKKNLIKRKDLVIQKADKGKTVVIIDRTKYLEGIKPLLSDCNNYFTLLTNYIINLETKLKDCFKVL